MEEEKINVPMLGSNAPRFTANSTFGPLKLTDYIGKNEMTFFVTYC